MNEIFRPPRKQLFTGLACAAFFAGMAVLVLAIFLFDEAHKPPWGVWSIALFAAGGCIGAVLLFAMRYMIPKQGLHDLSMQATFRNIQRDEPEALWMMGWMLLALVVTIAFAAAVRCLHFAPPFWLQMTGLAIAGIGFVAILAWSTRCSYVREQKRKAELEAEWNAEHASV